MDIIAFRVYISFIKNNTYYIKKLYPYL